MGDREREKPAGIPVHNGSMSSLTGLLEAMVIERRPRARRTTRRDVQLNMPNMADHMTRENMTNSFHRRIGG